MKREELSFRIVKIGKVAASVAVCGLMTFAMSSPAFAVGYDIQNGASPVPTIAVTQNSINVYSSTDGSAYTGYLNLNLASGADLTGEVVIGGTPWAVFTSKYTSGDQWVRFSDANVTSSLTLNGNNEITGVVGWYLDNAGGNANGAAPLDVIQIYNSGNIFNSQVYATAINLNSGSTVQFLGNIGDGTYASALNYQGSNSVVTLGAGVTLYGGVTNTAISNSVLTFNGNGTITGSVGSSTTAIGTVNITGNNSLVRVNGNLSTDLLNYQANATVAVGGNLYLNVDASNNAYNQVAFDNTDGTLQVGGNIVGLSGHNAVTTTANNKGTVTMLSGTQTITGNVGSSGAAIKTLNIGGTGSGVGIDTNTDAVSSTTISGNVYAQTISLNNDNTSPTSSSSLNMASGFNLTGAVVTDGNGLGNLTMLGGTQTVTGTVGTSGAALNTVTSGTDNANTTFTGAIYATNVNNSGAGTSTYQGAVTATDIGVNAGTSNFQGNVSAVTTTISSGTANFSNDTNHSATATTDIAFTGTGTANLANGLTGNINYAGNDGVVNLSDTKAISGTVSGTNKGILNALGSGTLDGAVGTLSQLNVNRVTADATGDTTGATSKTLVVNQNVSAASIKLFNDGGIQVADSKNLTGAVTTTTNNTGFLTLAGTTAVTGNVGAAGTALRAVNAGANSSASSFSNGVVYATSLNYSGNGSVQFNGLNTKSAAVVTNGVLTSGGSDLGFVGTVDFGTNVTNTGTFVLGDNVDLITQHAASPAANTQTTFVDANGATLTFAGSSVVNGQLGSGTVLNGAINTIGSDAFKAIYAGVAGETVTFLNDVYVSGNTFHVSGTGTVNFVGDLNGPLVYDADGFVNVANGKLINGTVTTATTNTGTLNFVGGATTKAAIGSSTRLLKAVNFHASTSDAVALPVTAADVTVNIGHDVYATNTTIGTNQNTNADATIANLTSGVFLGQNLTLAANTTNTAASNVTLNTAGAVYSTTGVSPVDFVHTKNANGTLTNTATVTQSTFGSATTGVMATNGATLNFAVGTTDWASNAGGTVNTASSSRISSSGTSSTLVMNGAETVNLSLLGSLRDGQAYTLIDVAGGVGSGNTSVPGTLNDNSYVIDTVLSRANGGSGDLVVTASRADNEYITKSATTGHFSNAAALRLGTLAADGSAYGSDMQTVLNKLDIDQWGFGNNQANLAVQVKRLAPIANNSLPLSAFRTASELTDSVGLRMQELRISETKKPYDNASIWIKSLTNTGKQDALGSYDGFKTKIGGFTLGTDSHPNRDSIVGAALSYNDTKVEQQDFRLGDTAKLNGVHLSLFAAYDITPELYVEGTATAGRLNTVSNRSTVVARVATADYDSSQITAKAGLGYRIKFDDSTTTLTPMISVEGSRLSQDAYQETGAGDIGLSVAQQTWKRAQSAIGLRLATTQMWGGVVVKPELSVLATKDFHNLSQPISAQYIGDNTSSAQFDTQVANKSAYDLTGYRVNFGLNMLMSKTSSLSFRYNRNKNASFVSNAVDLTARWDF